MNLTIGGTLWCIGSINHLFRDSDQYPWLRSDPGLIHNGPGTPGILAGKITHLTTEFFNRIGRSRLFVVMRADIPLLAGKQLQDRCEIQ
jgi:hypothetical protein